MRAPTLGATTPKRRRNNTYETKLLILMAPPGATTMLQQVIWTKRNEIYLDSTRASTRTAFVLRGKEKSVHTNQTVAEMANEVLTRQAAARVRRTGEPFGVALCAVLCTEGGLLLWKLSRGAHCHERASEWQKNLARKRAEERVDMTVTLS